MFAWRILSAVAALLLGTASARTQFPDCINGPLASNLVCNPRASPAERAAALVAALQTDEKLVNLVECVLTFSPQVCIAYAYILHLVRVSAHLD